MSVDNPILTIIIINYNTFNLTRDCIDSISRYIENINYEIIVVDNHSRDNSGRDLQEIFPAINVLALNDNYGYAYAINRGTEIARGEFILILNSDIVWLEDAVTQPIQYLRDNPDCAVLGCKLLNPDLSLQGSIYFYPSLTREFLNALGISPLLRRSRLIKAVLIKSMVLIGRDKLGRLGPHDKITEVQGLKGAYILTRRKVLIETGGFDEKIFLYGEETEWFIRLREAEYKIVFYPDVKVIHIGEGSNKEITISPMFTTRYFSLKYIFNKHYTKQQVFHLMIIMVIAIILRMITQWIRYTLFSDKFRLKYYQTYRQTLKRIFYE